ncbi:MAG: hypothetical protein ACM33V_11905 [Chloroflexota bacterium]|nr:hypothetical protein [Anaerolineales bacterium]
MRKKTRRLLGCILLYLPLAGILYASFLNLTALQHQVLMLLLLVWANSFFLYKSWAA